MHARVSTYDGEADELVKGFDSVTGASRIWTASARPTSSSTGPAAGESASPSGNQKTLSTRAWNAPTRCAKRRLTRPAPRFGRSTTTRLRSPWASRKGSGGLFRAAPSKNRARRSLLPSSKRPGGWRDRVLLVARRGSARVIGCRGRTEPFPRPGAKGAGPAFPPVCSDSTSARRVSFRARSDRFDPCESASNPLRLRLDVLQPSLQPLANGRERLRHAIGTSL